MARNRKGETDEPPDSTPPRRTVHHRGPERSIVFAKLADKTEPAQVFYLSLDDGDRDKFDILFLHIGKEGKIRNDQKFHPNVGEIACKNGNIITKYRVSEFKVHSGGGFEDSSRPRWA
jgi:hypothetical protein